MRTLGQRLPGTPALLRAGLVLFVLLWIFGPYELRTSVPVWIAFVVALGLEVNFFLGALRPAPAPARDRGPQEVDRERYGWQLRHEGEAEDEALDEDEEGWDPEWEWVPERGRGGAARALRRLAAGLAVIGALALVFWFVESRTGWDSLADETRAEATARFSAEASQVAGKPVAIQCDESGERVGVVQHADGVAIVGGELAWLTPQICHDLYRLAFEGEVTSSQTARAIAVLAHEAWHLRGVRDEGETECYALQSGVGVAVRLGLTEDTARRMMRQQLVENAGRGGAGAEYVVPPECRDGGALDLDPEGGRFP
ncbi:MAG TPA: hypothetical protein VD704_00095 [Gaiellaceae bacterium]|nr:hypothetical protein [Gaiellaceae bacterium]